MDKINLQTPMVNLDYPIKLEDHLWMLGNYFFNLYLVQGHRASALIEVGISAVVDTVIMQLESLGITPTYLIITHPHADHITGLKGLLDRYPDARVIAGKDSEEFISHPKAIINMVKEDNHMSQRMESLGLTPGRSPVSEFFFPDEYIPVADQYDIDLGEIHLHCKLVEGHSPGNILVHAPAIGALAPSDSMGFHYPNRGFLPLFLTNYHGYMETLLAMESLKPKILCLGHQGYLTGSDVSKAFYLARSAAEKMLSRIAQDEKEGDQLADKIFQEYYKDEFTLYTEDNIRTVSRLLVRRGREHLKNIGGIAAQRGTLAI